MSADPGKAKSIFLKAADIDLSAQRQAFLSDACGADAGAEPDR